MSRKNGRRLSDKDTRQAKIQTGTRVAGIDGKTAPPRLWSIAARRSGFAFARVPGVVRRLERMRGARRRRHRNAAGRTRPVVSRCGRQPFEAGAQKLRLVRLVRNLRSALTRSRAGPGSPACASASRAACAIMPSSSTATRSSTIVSVQTDNCDLQTFYPFERMPTGLAPLH
jgi:hypothetical protein